MRGGRTPRSPPPSSSSSTQRPERNGRQGDPWFSVRGSRAPAPFRFSAGQIGCQSVPPIWLGDNSSVMKQVIERLYACSSILNSEGQYAYYGRVGGCLITGNEDGAKHCAMNVLYSLQHLGYVIPPQADAGWVGGRARGRPISTPARVARERLHQPQHHLHDLEPAPPGPPAQGRRWHPRPRQPALRVGRRAAASTLRTLNTDETHGRRRRPGDLLPEARVIRRLRDSRSARRLPGRGRRAAGPARPGAPLSPRQAVVAAAVEAGRSCSAQMSLPSVV
ncbi:hypothetical protein FB465_6721 [Kitasatospora atroaurantiaca]|uniref:Uncharacterized protein n=1 Tax=Kitasatospora atroaurantiaca TaxID=285545 RepID=A0A561F0Z0_9ACTN|nr:hypothetical protein FB465_6721 [Kitasatospora atroaurantiaca]